MAGSGAPIIAPVGAPHGGRIVRIALTDRGDAALTLDSFFELRLWPTLDGSREPVIVHGPRAMQLALGRDGDRLYAALLDEAGNVALLVFDPRGGLVGRGQLAAGASAGVPITQVVAVAGGVVVRCADE
ncbi:MAG TPA: hypothetical protein VH165_13260, partial [Kofleriaceae bacterium]|nr:hypothetical protein [Kofleriaceae bacterium]